MLQKVIDLAEKVKEYMTIFNAAVKAFNVFTDELKNPSFNKSQDEN